MQAGQYGVVQTGGGIGRLIQLATHSWANHAFIVIDDGKIIEARPEGVAIKSIAEYNGARMAFSTDVLTDAQRAKVVETAQSFVGDGYGFLDIGALGLESLGWHWRWLFKLAGADKNVMICSQLVAMCGQAAGVDWLCGKASPVEVTPGDLAKRPGVTG